MVLEYRFIVQSISESSPTLFAIEWIVYYKDVIML